MKLIVAVVTSLVLVGTVAGADEDREREARRRYEHGKAAYTQGDYATAYDDFRESFQLSHEPALLYNIASALQGLHRPHDAAESLRSFLRLRPDDPDRAQIEERVRTLEEEQRLLDLERKPKEPTPAPVAPPPAPLPPPPAPTVVSQPPPPIAATAPPPPERSHKRTWIIVGVAAGGVVVAGLALGLAFGLQPKEQPLTPSPIGPIAGTR